MYTKIRINFENDTDEIIFVDKFEMLDDREVVQLFSAMYDNWTSFQILKE